jgi:hypothetical protein
VVTSAPGRPVLTVVGLAASVTNSADGWVTPAEVTRLRAPGRGPRPSGCSGSAAGTPAAVRADAGALGAALTPGAVLGTGSYLTVRTSETARIGPFVPFLVAFGVIGRVLSVLIVANVVSGAVVSGYRRIGVLKSIGFTPGQVVAAYTEEITVAGLTGQHRLTAFRGPAAWTGYPLISGHWYTGPGQVVVSTGFLTLTGRPVGDTVTLLLGSTPLRVRIVGEDFDATDRGVSVITDIRTLAAAGPPG